MLSIIMTACADGQWVKGMLIAILVMVILGGISGSCSGGINR